MLENWWWQESRCIHRHVCKHITWNIFCAVAVPAVNVPDALLEVLRLNSSLPTWHVPLELIWPTNMGHIVVLLHPSCSVILYKTTCYPQLAELGVFVSNKVFITCIRVLDIWEGGMSSYVDLLPARLVCCYVVSPRRNYRIQLVYLNSYIDEWWYARGQ